MLHPYPSLPLFFCASHFFPIIGFILLPLLIFHMNTLRTSNRVLKNARRFYSMQPEPSVIFVHKTTKKSDFDQQL